MTRYNDDSDEDWTEEDGNYDSGEDDDELEMVLCPYCREEILEDAERCPYCENYISSEDLPSQPRPLWLVFGAVSCLIVILMWVLSGLLKTD